MYHEERFRPQFFFVLRDGENDFLRHMGFLAAAVPPVATGWANRHAANLPVWYPVLTTSVGAPPVGVNLHSWQAAPKEQRQ